MDIYHESRKKYEKNIAAAFIMDNKQLRFLASLVQRDSVTP